MILTNEARELRDRENARMLNRIRRNSYDHYTIRKTDRSLSKAQREYAAAFLAGADGKECPSPRNYQKTAHRRGRQYRENMDTCP